MKKKAPFDGAVTFCLRRDVRDAVRDTLKSMGVSLGQNFDSSEECILQLEANRTHLLVIDWELGGAEVIKVLESVRGDRRIETRPIFLLAKELTPQIISAGYEYAVSQTHSGPVSKSKIKSCLEEIFRYEHTNAPVKQVLQEVSVARCKNDWHTATVLLENMHNKLPGNARIAVELAENYIRDDRWSDAIDVLDPFSSAHPPYSRVLHVLGRCHMKSGNFSEASIVLTKAKILNPFDVNRLVDLGNSLMSNLEFTDAKNNFTEARCLDPKNKGAIVGEGKCLLVDGEVNEALSLLKDVADTRELASIFNMSAVLTVRNGKFEEAMSLYDSACQAVGQNDKILSKLIFNKGLGYRKQKKFRKSLALFEESFGLDPKFEKARRNIEELRQKLADQPNSKNENKSGMNTPSLAKIGFSEHPTLGTKKPGSSAEDGGVADVDFGEGDELEDEFGEESITFV